MSQIRLPSQDNLKTQKTQKTQKSIKNPKKFEGKKRVQCDSQEKKGRSEQMTVEKSNLASSAYSLWHMSCRRP